MGTTTRTTLLLLSAALGGCVSTGPSPQWLDARASSSEPASGDYADQCMIARGLSPRWQ